MSDEQLIIMMSLRRISDLLKAAEVVCGVSEDDEYLNQLLNEADIRLAILETQHS